MARMYSVGSKAEEAAMAREFMKRKTPTVQEVRQESRTRKAEAVVKPATAKRQAIQGKPGESQISRAEAERKVSRQGSPSAPKSSAPFSRGKGSPPAPKSSPNPRRGEEKMSRTEAERMIKKRTFLQKLQAGGIREVFKMY